MKNKRTEPKLYKDTIRGEARLELIGKNQEKSAIFADFYIIRAIFAF